MWRCVRWQRRAVAAVLGVVAVFRKHNGGGKVWFLGGSVSFYTIITVEETSLVHMVVKVVNKWWVAVGLR
ncbi:hypothetical protein HanXRQr2_Chr13g0582561 [Helianthus annuus]|uniref:Uncharacterized protein n=1 Tax=Helianthus annuus TaxID=4232 RepID=A0A251SRG8_HELAN|nr:hypothetical protein HanXRQr2_Chr13g0582561 [Helianthus annuus]KAJ0848713.1 hypothetical protein HanPSC8_Chr13g0560691 [Helianthus annuus]